MNWLGDRFEETFEYVQVAWLGWNEMETYNYITSGSIEMSSDTELKVTGSFEFEGSELPSTTNLLRVYYSFRDSKYNYTRVPLGTFFVSYSNVRYQDTLKGVKVEGSLSASSVLKKLDDDLIGRPLTIKAGDNVITVASKIITNAGLNVEIVPSPERIKNDYTFPAGTSELDIVNYLCSVAKYNPAWPDANGTVQLRPEKNTSEVEFTFANDDNSIMYPEIDETANWQNIPNVYKLLYNTDLGCVVAEAKNVTGSRVSLDAVGQREIVAFEEVSDIGEGVITTALRNLAESKLKESSADIEYVKLSHAYYPVYLYSKVGVEYSDMSWSGDVCNMSITLSTSVRTQTKIKRVGTTNIIIETSSSVLRQLDNINVDEI